MCREIDALYRGSLPAHPWLILAHHQPASFWMLSTLPPPRVHAHRAPPCRCLGQQRSRKHLEAALQPQGKLLVQPKGTGKQAWHQEHVSPRARGCVLVLKWCGLCMEILGRFRGMQCLRRCGKVCGSCALLFLLMCREISTYAGCCRAK